MKAVAVIVALLAIAALAALGGNTTPAAAQQNANDKAALEALYDNTGGANWTNSTNWKTSADLGQWHGVTTDSNGRVTAISMSNNNMTGSLPSELGNLTYMTSISLEGHYSKTGITGGIPKELGNLTNLEVLAIEKHSLTGTIPTELGDLTNLYALNFHRNNLTGTIPTELGDLTNLYALNFHRNNLTGTIPTELGDLTNLTNLWLDSNDLSGSIPTELGNLSNLFWLDLGANSLSGSIPTELGDLSSLYFLYLQDNNLSGSIPTELGNLSSLDTLYLSGNNLSGSIPAELGDLTNLSWLDLSANNLSGSIPTELGNLSNLWVLWLNGNNLSGCIPQSLQNVVNNDFDRLGLPFCADALDPQREALMAFYHATSGPTEWNNKHKWGTLHPIGEWHGVTTDSDGQVTEISLSQNGLYGTLPDSLADLEQLSRLDLDYNSIFGTIPSRMGELDNLTVLRMGSNQLRGPIPPALGKLSSLSILGLGNNRLDGPIPSELGNLRSLTRLSLWSNQLDGSIPPELGQLKSLAKLNLGRNQLSGPIPPELADLTNLAELGLLGNDWSGCIPEGLRLVPYHDLERLVDSNDQPLALPWCGSEDRAALLAFYNATGGSGWKNQTNWDTNQPVGKWHGVTVDADGRVVELRLPNNGLTGRLGNSLDDLGRLTLLDLAQNSITGAIPSGLGELANLATLRMGSNQLRGRIPPALGKLGNLSILGLENNGLGANGLYGSIPSELSKLRSLTELSLHGNRLSGSIPPELANLLNLDTLNLRDNNLSGCIPDQLRNVASHDLDRVVGADGQPLPDCGSVDRAALVALYNATDGPKWARQTGWNTTQPIGDWRGVVTDANGFVTGLSLRSNGLSGPLPAGLASLEYLETLDLQGNELTGPIPAGLGSLPRLEKLRLNNNLLTGPIPWQLGNLSNLEELDLSYNRLNGYVPWLGLLRLNKLQFLYLNDQSYFRGRSTDGVSEIVLGRWNRDENHLRGSLPSNLGAFYPDLVWLALSNNRLSGTIPATMTDLDELGGLFLSGNKFTGCVPAALHDVPSNDLADIGLSTCFDNDSDKKALLALYDATGGEGGWTSWKRNANWGSDMPLNEWDGVTADKDGRVTGLYLAGNNLKGQIPAALGNLTALQALDLSGNNLEGQIPAALGNLTALQSLDLGDNKLKGQIPAELGRLSNLTELKLNYNQLEDPIPSSLGELDGLQTLYLANNNFVSCLPPALHDIANKTNVNVDYGDLLKLSCNITPAEQNALLAFYWAATGYSETQLEDWAAQQGCFANPSVANLRVWCGVEDVDAQGRVAALDLSGKGLTGTISPALSNLTGLTNLNLSDNQLKGEIPNELGELRNLTRLNLSDNQLTGGMLAVQNLTNLTFLDLSDNKLEGAIQSSVQGLVNLTWLNLSNYKRTWLNKPTGNAFHGDINFIGKLENLRWLDLSGNQFSGQVTCDFAQLTALEHLDLSENQLKGDITPVMLKLSRINDNGELDAYLRGNEWSSAGNGRSAEYWIGHAGKIVSLASGKVSEIEIDGQTIATIDFDKISKFANRSALLLDGRKGTYAVATVSWAFERATRFVYWAGPAVSWLGAVLADENQAVFFFNVFIEGDLPFEASKKYFGKFGIRLSNCGLFTVGDELCNAYQSLGHPNAPVDPETPLGKEQGADELPCGSHETDES